MDQLNIRNIIQEQQIRTQLQPIISIKEKRIVGFEALCRGMDSRTGELIPPLRLFASARQEGMGLIFDRLCRREAIRSFAATGLQEKRHILFVNFDPSILREVIIGNGWMERLVRSHGLSPSSMAIEIVESGGGAQSDLKKFVDLYREKGFLIVLDDFGAQHSNLDRILLLRPDIIKIDRHLIFNVSEDFYKQSIVGSIAELTSKIGSIVLAEGVESLADIIKCYELGVDLFQGFHFSRPVPPDRIDDGFCQESIRTVSRAIYTHLNHQVISRQQRQQRHEQIAAAIRAGLAALSAFDFDAFLRTHLLRYKEIQCIYVLDENGIQISDTACKPGAICRRPRHMLFRPAARGTDHSLKDYFFYLQILNLNSFFTDPYTSFATGNICQTMSTPFSSRDHEPFILCIDFDSRATCPIR